MLPLTLVAHETLYSSHVFQSKGSNLSLTVQSRLCYHCTRLERVAVYGGATGNRTPISASTVRHHYR